MMIDQKGGMTKITSMPDFPDVFIEKGLERYYKIGFSQCFDLKLMRQLGGVEQMESLVHDISKKLYIEHHMGEMAILFQNMPIFNTQLDNQRNLITNPGYIVDKITGISHLPCAKGIDELLYPLYYSPDPKVGDIELLVNLTYHRARLENLLRRADIVDNNYYQELREVISPRVQILGPIS